MKDEELPELDDGTPDLTVDTLEEFFDEYLRTNIVRGLPEGEVYDWKDEYDDYYGRLHRCPPKVPLDYIVLTEAELRERWSCNSETLIRLLRKFELGMEHKGLKNRMGTYEELTRTYHPEGDASRFAFVFFDFGEDALFRLSDVIEFEKDNPEVIKGLINLVEGMSLGSHTRKNGPISQASVLPPPIPTVKNLSIEIESHLRDHDVAAHRK
jgi:hypothetical protein